MIDVLWPDGPRFKYEDGVFRPCTDSVLLAYFVKSARVKKKRAADLCCGSGLISVILAWDEPELLIDGVEIQPRAASLALENAKLCGLADRINIIEGDLRRYAELFQSGVYDITVANPPYYASGKGKHSRRADVASARSDEYCNLDDICQAAGYMTRWGGSFMLVHRPDRLPEIFRSLNTAGFEPKRLRFVQYKHFSPPSLVLLENRRGGKPSLKIEAPLILANEDGGNSDEFRMIYRLAT
ncbi:MAG: methyltransferase [Oscillospiraceae bacterium]|nr:methyltransferase [Oscillospiraceae bacterium]